MDTGHQGSQTSSEIEPALTQTSIEIIDNSTTSRPDNNQKDTCKLLCRAVYTLLCMPLVMLVFILVGTAPSIVLLVLLAVSFVVLTLLQMVRHGDQYDKVTQLKFIIRFWILLSMTWFILSLRFINYIAKKVWSAKQNSVMLMGMSIDEWFAFISAAVTTLYTNDFMVNLFLHLVPPIPLGYNDSGVSFREAMFEIVDCVCLLLSVSEVINKFTSLKEHKTLGLYTWRWLQVSILVVIGHNAIKLCIHLIVWLIRKLVSGRLDPANITSPQHKQLVQKLLPSEDFVYYANGLKRSLTFVLTSLLILLTWVLYFDPHLRKNSKADKILHFGTRTCLSLLICSVLWLVKTWAVLSWEATAMYTRLRSEILESANQFYFLGILTRHSHDILKLIYHGSSNRESSETHFPSYLSWLIRFYRYVSLSQLGLTSAKNLGFLGTLGLLLAAYLNIVIDMTNPDFLNRSRKDAEEGDLGERKGNQHQVKKMSGKKREKTKYDLLMHNRTATIHDIKQVTGYLISAQTALTDPSFVSSTLDKLAADNDADIRKKLEQLIATKSSLNGAAPSGQSGLPEELEHDNRNSNAAPVEENKDEDVIQSSSDALIRPLSKDDWKYFEQEVLKDENCSKIFIRNWLEKSQNSCLFLSNSLSSTKEVVYVLNKIVSYLIIGATFIIWLLLTGLTSTAVLVLIGSPLVAASFIFGDTCKTLFQGIMYVYVVHPIHVGDLCSVDEKKLVVKAVGVWTTTFYKVETLGTLEEVTYPNSELAMKVVINNLIEFVSDDSLEINLGSLKGSDNVKILKEQIETHLNKREDEFVPCSHSVAVQEEGDNPKMIIKLKYKITNIKLWSYLKCVRRKEKLQADVDALIEKLNEEQNLQAV